MEPIEIQMRKHRSIWYSLPEEVRYCLNGGFGGVDAGMVFYEDHAQALSAAHGKNVVPCLEVITEEGKRVVGYPAGNLNRLEHLVDQALILAVCPSIKIARKLWCFE